MCGITGAVSFSGRTLVSRDKLKEMTDTLYHRGPDEYGLAEHEGASFGMRRLSIIDLKGGSQPIYNEDRSVWTVFNGEIYNFPELRKTLEYKGHRFNSHTDTEVIVHAYEEYGSEFSSRLNGMFAIALHDRKNKKIILSRDHIGIKPFYYYASKDFIVFGSEIKSLLASGLIKKELNIDALAEFLSWEYIPGRGTLLSGVKKLEPGHYIEIDLENPNIEPREYWDIAAGNGADENLSDEDWEALVDEQLRKSVNMQMISDVPLGAFLSGGVDSSLIVASMGEAKTFSIGFDDPSYNELEWAKKAAVHLRVDHKDKIIKPNVYGLFEHLMKFMDDPIGDFSIFPTYLVSELAREHVTVALSGDGGDELFGGYETYAAQNLARTYSRVPKLFRGQIIEPAVSLFKPTTKKKGLINKSKRFIEGFSYQDEMLHARWRIFMGDLMRNEIFTEDALGKINTPAANHILNLFEKSGARGDLNKSLYVDVKSYLADNILTKVDRMSMAVSLETRVPFLDPDLVNLAFRIPENLKVKNRNTKVLLKKLAAKYLPKEVIYRPKEGFSIPIKNWLGNEFRPLMEDLLDEKKIKSDGIFNSKKVVNLKNEHLSGEANHSHILWALIVFHDWQNRWLKN